VRGRSPPERLAHPARNTDVPEISGESAVDCNARAVFRQQKVRKNGLCCRKKAQVLYELRASLATATAQLM
jgi:hypothetical protein